MYSNYQYLSKNYTDINDFSYSTLFREYYSDSSPIIMICCCQKYIEYLHAAVKRFTNSSWKVVGIVGGVNKTTYDDKTNILSLEISDTYENLPSKIHAAIEWIYKKWPNCSGIFKTDDDIIMDIEELSTLLLSTNEKYMGLNVEGCGSNKVDKGRIASRFDNTSLSPTHQSAHYCWGAGYWLHNSVLPFIINEKDEYDNSALEDVCTGYVLNKNGVYPSKISIDWKEAPRNHDLLNV